MKRAIYFVAAAAMLVVAMVLGTAEETQAQERYYWTNARGRYRVIPVNWRPDSIIPYKRYTVAVDALQLVHHGIKFDFEGELRRRPGEWLQTSLTVYTAPPRKTVGSGRYDYDYYPGYDSEESLENYRDGLNSGYDSYMSMWGVGTSLLFKKMLHPRGWYFSTGLKFDYYNVKVKTREYIPFTEDGLTFYEQGTKLHQQSFYKPTLQFNFGKHITVSKTCFFDIYVGVNYSYSFHNREKLVQGESRGYYSRPYKLFTTMDGFAYRGFSPNFGARFGILIWQRDDRRF